MLSLTQWPLYLLEKSFGYVFGRRLNETRSRCGRQRRRERILAPARNRTLVVQPRDYSDRILIEMPQGKRPFGKPWCNWEQMKKKAVRCGVYWIHLALDNVRLLAHVSRQWTFGFHKRREIALLVG
jgi:hypothetical protein